MTTYTIAVTTEYQDAMLLASCPDDSDIDEAVAKEHAWERDEDEPAWKAISGLIFTDDEPDDEDKIVWGPGVDRGWLIDEIGRTYRYAIRP